MLLERQQGWFSPSTRLILSRSADTKFLFVLLRAVVPLRKKRVIDSLSRSSLLSTTNAVQVLPVQHSRCLICFFFSFSLFVMGLYLWSLLFLPYLQILVMSLLMNLCFRCYVLLLVHKNTWKEKKKHKVLADSLF